jgi:hypothetical protein
MPLGLPTLGTRDPHDVRSALAEEWVELRELSYRTSVIMPYFENKTPNTVEPRVFTGDFS